MEPVTVVVSAGQMYLVFGAVAGFVAGWFAGGYYKSRRVQGMTKEQVVEEAKTLTEAKFLAGFKVIMNEIEKVKAKLPQ
jgi:hypothetical protein